MAVAEVAPDAGPVCLAPADIHTVRVDLSIALGLDRKPEVPPIPRPPPVLDSVRMLLLRENKRSFLPVLLGADDTSPSSSSAAARVRLPLDTPLELLLKVFDDNRAPWMISDRTPTSPGEATVLQGSVAVAVGVSAAPSVRSGVDLGRFDTDVEVVVVAAEVPMTGEFLAVE